jgi:hypothetical protein
MGVLAAIDLHCKSAEGDFVGVRPLFQHQDITRALWERWPLRVRGHFELVAVVVSVGFHIRLHDWFARGSWPLTTSR